MDVFKKLSANDRKKLKKGVIEISGRAMNRTALGIVDAMFRLYPNATFDEMKQMLPDSINESAPKNYKSLFKPYTSKPYGVIQSHDIIEEAKKQDINISASHFTEKNEMFTTADGVKVLVSKSWESKDTSNQTKDLQNLINHVKQYGVSVIDYDKNKAFEKGKYSIEFINKPLFDELTGKQKNNMNKTLILVALAIIGISLIWYMSSTNDKEEIISECSCGSIDECLAKNNIDCAWKFFNDLEYDKNENKLKIIKVESINFIEKGEYKKGWNNLAKQEFEYLWKNDLMAYKYEYLNLVIDELIEEGEITEAKIWAMKGSENHNIEGWTESETSNFDEKKTQRKLLLQKVKEFE